MDSTPTGTQGDGERPDHELERILFRAMERQEAMGIVLVDADLRVTRSNIDPGRFPGLTLTPGSRLTDMVPPGEAAGLTARLRRLLATGRPVYGYRQRLGAYGELILSLSAMPVAGPGDPPESDGSRIVLSFINATRETGRIDLLFDAAAMIGASLDVTDSAQQLADALVPALGDEAVVYLASEVFDGEDPPVRRGDTGGDCGGDGVGEMRCAALAPVDRSWPEGFIQPGTAAPRLPRAGPASRVKCGENFLLSGPAEIEATLAADPGLTRLLVPPGATGVIHATLLARGRILGGVSVWRGEASVPYAEDDLRLLEEVASRAALSIDNARRYTRERNASVALQRSMLPVPATDAAAVEAAGVYLPATAAGHGVGGDWYDVIPLSSLRVGLVVGDVVGHGLRATATMGRIRTALQALADLDLGPDDLLTHLDDLVLRIVDSEGPAHEGALASTCLYAVYDPVARRCAMASAGHPPPAIVRPDGTVDFVRLEPGPPLGVGGLPFEVTEIDLEPGSILALYSDGLVTYGHDHDLAVGTRSFREGLAGPHTDVDLQATAARMVAGILPGELADDVTLLLARVRATADEDVASWQITAEPSAVTSARNLTVRQLAAWDLEDLAFTTELMVSELVTNAIRYAGGPIGLRLIRDSREELLVCEVSDPSNTQPRLRQARSTDEGGRGLFLVAQLAHRWGSRYNSTGKTIWTEQSLTADDAGELGNTAALYDI